MSDLTGKYAQLILNLNEQLPNIPVFVSMRGTEWIRSIETIKPNIFISRIEITSQGICVNMQHKCSRPFNRTIRQYPIDCRICGDNLVDDDMGYFFGLSPVKKKRPRKIQIFIRSERYCKYDGNEFSVNGLTLKHGAWEHSCPGKKDHNQHWHYFYQTSRTISKLPITCPVCFMKLGEGLTVAKMFDAAKVIR